jgi:hypothetical protein
MSPHTAGGMNCQPQNCGPVAVRAIQTKCASSAAASFSSFDPIVLSNVVWWRTSEAFGEDPVASCADLLETEIRCRTMSRGGETLKPSRVD